MSTILEALRKVQSEKKTSDNFNPAERLIQGSPPPRFILSYRKIFMIGAACITISGGIGWLYLYTSSKTNTPATQEVLWEKHRKELPEVRPVQPQETVAIQPNSISPTQVETSRPPSNRSKSASTETKTGMAITPVKSNSKNLNQTLDQPTPKPKGAEHIPTTITRPQTVPDEIKLTGVVWQEARKLRRAIINDMIISEGSFAKDYRVKEIRQKGVLLEKNGVIYEATMKQ